jgi:Uma2 family endonuclease
MATALQTKSERQAPAEQRILLENIRWQTYQALCEDLDGCHIRMTYDRGRLEFMTLSREHEVYKYCIGMMIDTLALELGIPYDAGGSTTHRREDIEKGLEPDQCYYIRNEPLIRGRMKLDLTQDPPPDLAVEVDITRSSINRLGIYAALGVAEVWRYDGEAFRVYHLQEQGGYALAATSLSFPWLPIAEVARFLDLIPTMDKTTWMRSFRDWVREHVVPRAREAAEGRE